jgi:4-hydroxy-tetrahydrodipicolinate reductase
MKKTIGILGKNGHMANAITEHAQENFSQNSFVKENKENQENLFKSCDCLIDFTHPDKLKLHLEHALKNATPMMIGTTGLTDKQLELLQQAAKNIPVLYATNTSIGLHVMLSLTQQAAKALNEDYDIEIFEKHHNRKVDAPSGTAITIAQYAASGRNMTPPTKDAITLERNGKRARGDIGFSVLRGGDIIGEHCAGFYSAQEHIEITHKAQSRSVFADGAIKAALWLCEQKEAKLYTMEDFLSL